MPFHRRLRLGLAGVEVRATDDPARPADQWSRLTSALVRSNNAVRVKNLNNAAPRQYFIISEPP